MLQRWNKPSRSTDKNVVDGSYNEFMKFDLGPAIKKCKNETDRLRNLFINTQIKTSMNRDYNINYHGYFNDHDYITYSEAEHLNKINHVTKELIEIYEKKTRNQSKSKLWRNLRKSRITASLAGDVVKTVTTKKMSTNISKRILSPIKLNVPAVVHGKKLEKKAFNDYKTHFKIVPCGLFIDSERHYLAASPDGIDEEKKFIIEIKCPYRKKTVQELPYIIGGKLNKNHNYYYQIQIQLHVTQINECRFLVYIEEGFIHIETVFRDDLFLKTCLENIDYYYKNIFSKEYFKHVDEKN